MSIKKKKQIFRIFEKQNFKATKASCIQNISSHFLRTEWWWLKCDT